MRTASQGVGSEAEELPLVGPYVWDSLPQFLQCQARWHKSVHYGLLYVRRGIRQLHTVVEECPVHPRNGRQHREADLNPLTDGPCIDDEMFDLHEGKIFKVRDFLVIRWREGNLIASPYFPRSGGMFVEWFSPPEKANGQGCLVDVKMTKLRGEK